jgi:hypothetical protein
MTQLQRRDQFEQVICRPRRPIIKRMAYDVKSSRVRVRLNRNSRLSAHRLKARPRSSTCDGEGSSAARREEAMRQ